MTIQPLPGDQTPEPEPQAMLFTPGPRLGWTYTDHRSMIARYGEPPPNLEAIKTQAAERLADAERRWQRARRWGLRPSLMVFVALVALGGCAHALNRNAPFGTTILTAFILALPGTGWALWRLAQLNLAKDVDPRRQYQALHEGWRQRAAAHEHAGLAQLAGVPEWGSADSPSRRTDVFGGTLAGWQCLLTVHGASILAERPLLVADLTGQDAAGDLAALTRHVGVQTAEYVLPRDLNSSGLLTRLNPPQLARALAEAIHAGAPGTARSDRAVDVRVLEQLCAALSSGGITLARLAAAAEAALGRTPPPGLLAPGEDDFIKGPLFGTDYKPQIAANLVRLDAFLSDLARYDRGGFPDTRAPAYCTFFVAEPAARSAHAEMLAALVIQWLTVQVTASAASAPAVIVAGADEITGHHLEGLADACDRSGVPLTLLFRHLRNDATAVVGGGATAFMRLGNHHEAEQAASFIGRQHKFVLSSLTATHGAEQSTTRGQTQTWGHGESRGFHWDRQLGGAGTRSHDFSKNYSWATEFSRSDGTSWSDATTRQRVYEFAVEPAVLQRLPETALLLVGRNGEVQPVECHPRIVALPQAGTAPESVDERPAEAELGPAEQPAEYEPAEYEPAEYEPDSQEAARPTWPPQQPPDPRTWGGPGDPGGRQER
jgi:hypothetical protein